MTTRALIGGEVPAAADFTEPFDWDIVESDGTTALVLAANDVVHFELYSAAGGTLLLSIDDLTPSGNGSQVNITTRGNAGSNTPAAGQVILDEDDTAALTGKKHYVMWFKDTADSNRSKIFRRGTINFLAR